MKVFQSQSSHSHTHCCCVYSIFVCSHYDLFNFISLLYEFCLPRCSQQKLLSTNTQQTTVYNEEVLCAVSEALK